MNPGTPSALAADPLAELRGLHLPEAVGLWPPAPGWWVAAGLVAAMLGVAWIAWRRRRAGLGARALRELDRIQARADSDLAPLATALAELIRKVALERFGPARVAALSGAEWRRFLAQTWPRSRRAPAFDEAASDVLSVAPYAPPARWQQASPGAPIEHHRLIAATRTWIRGNS